MWILAVLECYMDLLLNCFPGSPERELAGNTIGGDFFGHLSDAPMTRAEIQATRAPAVKLQQRSRTQALAVDFPSCFWFRLEGQTRIKASRFCKHVEGEGD